MDQNNLELLRRRLIAEMERVFAADKRRIDHAMQVLRFAEKIRNVEGGDSLTVTAAAILHDIGIREAERKYGSASGRFQEIEGPPIAKSIMKKLGMDEPRIEHVCRIVGSHHSAQNIDTLEFRIIWDSDWLVNIPDEHAGKTPKELCDLANRIFRTKEGLRLAKVHKSGLEIHGC